MPGDWRKGKPYRPNVGICVINQAGLVWIGKTETSGPEIIAAGREWQMPQGGIEADEDLEIAARRELHEETGIRSVEILSVTSEWWDYDFPADYMPSNHKLDPFCGQRQRWVACRFTGDVAEVDLSATNVSEPAEFFDWKWENPIQILEISPEFKVSQYRRVFDAFDEYM